MRLEDIMSGTKIGGLKAATTNKQIHGNDFYKLIGKKGGSKLGVKKGFALMTREKVALCGQKGGRISRRKVSKKRSEYEDERVNYQSY